MNTFTFLAEYAKQFGKVSSDQAQGLTEILGFLQADHWLAPDVRKQAYLLATIKHECADKWRPIREFGSERYFVRRYWENESVRRQLGNLSPQDAVRYCGRGYVQITGRRNYALVQKELGVKALDTPGVVQDPSVSFQVAVRGMVGGWFTGKRFDHYFNKEVCLWEDARRIINGMDQAEKIAGYAKAIETILKASTK